MAAARVGQLGGGHLAGERPLVLPVAVLAGHGDLAVAERPRPRRQRDEGRRDDHLDARDVGDALGDLGRQRQDSFSEP